MIVPYTSCLARSQLVSSPTKNTASDFVTKENNAFDIKCQSLIRENKQKKFVLRRKKSLVGLTSDYRFQFTVKIALRGIIT
jgi:hypothetical protein